MLETIIKIAKDAGAAALIYYQGDINIVEKNDRSPLTQADLASHTVIASKLTKRYPEIPLISEEGTLPSYESRRNWDEFFLVDPLDGTKEFIKRNGEFTVNIALIRYGEPVLGVIYAPAIEELFYAKKGKGSFEEIDGEKRRLTVKIADPDAVYDIIESRSHPSAELETFLKTIKVRHRVVVGSSLKFCRVAQGKAHLYPRFGPTMEWDVAAGDCIYRNATTDGSQNPSPLTYNKQDLRNPPFVIGIMS